MINPLKYKVNSPMTTHTREYIDSPVAIELPYTNENVVEAIAIQPQEIKERIPSKAEEYFKETNRIVSFLQKSLRLNDFYNIDKIYVNPRHGRKMILKNGFKHARNYFVDHRHDTSQTYNVLGNFFSMRYNGYQCDAFGDRAIAKGTAFRNDKGCNSLTNLYEINCYANGLYIPTIRFGISVKSTLRAEEAIKTLLEHYSYNGTIISLIGSCGKSTRCKKANKYAKRINDAMREPEISEFENEIGIESFPLGFINASATTYSNNTPKETFESIVDISKLHFFACVRNTNDPPYLAFHCKSGKDRTSIFDAINKATYYVIAKQLMKVCNNFYYESNCMENEMKNLIIDTEEVRKLSQKFLLYGLLISFYSTGVLGLKLGFIPVTKYIFSDNPELLKFYKGIYA